MAINREKVLEAAQKYVEKQKYDKAIGELRKVVDADPSDARTLHKIGELQAKQGLYPEAINTFETVGRLYADGGFAQKAVAVYKHIREVIAAHVPQLAVRYGHIAPRLADLYREIGLTGEALALLVEVANDLQRQQKDAEALDVFRKIAELDFEQSAPAASRRGGALTCERRRRSGRRVQDGSVAPRAVRASRRRDPGPRASPPAQGRAGAGLDLRSSVSLA